MNENHPPKVVRNRNDRDNALRRVKRLTRWSAAGALAATGAFAGVAVRAGGTTKTVAKSTAASAAGTSSATNNSATSNSGGGNADSSSITPTTSPTTTPSTSNSANGSVTIVSGAS
jgi:hypothetical protein